MKYTPITRLMKIAAETCLLSVKRLIHSSHILIKLIINGCEASVAIRHCPLEFTCGSDASSYLQVDITSFCYYSLPSN